MNNQLIKHVDSYIYLGTAVNLRWDQTTKIQPRIEKISVSFNNFLSFFIIIINVPVPQKLKLIQFCIFPVFRYENETPITKIETFEMCVCVSYIRDIPQSKYSKVEIRKGERNGTSRRRIIINS